MTVRYHRSRQPIVIVACTHSNYIYLSDGFFIIQREKVLPRKDSLGRQLQNQNLRRPHQHGGCEENAGYGRRGKGVNLDIATGAISSSLMWLYAPIPLVL